MTDEEKKIDEMEQTISKLGLGIEKPVDSTDRRSLSQPINPPRMPDRAAVAFRPQGSKEPTLIEQMNRAEEIQTSLRNKIRREKLDMLQDHDRRWTEVKQTYANLIHDAVTKLEAERDKALRDLSDAYNAKAREHDLLLERMN